ncbi:MAG: hypothetical protein KC776_25095 [Myxococcales bacterium]|nr:hypothetical protein [Myxococcales bacterium]MCB9578031.1 hypothetical protein [Polyangiaceae bacterium]
MGVARFLAFLALPVVVVSACGGEPFDASAAGGAAGQDGGTGAGGGSGGDCASDEKFCAGKCVKQADPAFGCDVDGCNPCALQHALSACQGGACTVAKCDANWGDCSSEPGCETDLRRPETCGDCNTKCDKVCSNGQCADSCGGGETDCNGTCTDTASDPQHCGGCGKACEAPPSSTATCQAGNCGFQCKAPYEDCDGVGENGCEADTNNDVQNCSACGVSCATPPQGAVGEVCNGGQCGCAGARTSCSVSGGAACVNQNNDPQFCGSCNNACNHGQICSSKSCATPNCAAGLLQCEGKCVNLDTDPAHCGNCQTTCGALQTCIAGTCVPATSCAGAATCASTSTIGATCTDASTDAANCGTCGKLCAPGEACIGSSCTPAQFVAEPWECTNADTACVLPILYPAKMYCAPKCPP